MRKIRRRCKCGCKKVTNYGKKYIHGHHRRGKKLSAETKEKISKAKQGKKFSAESIKKMSEAKKGKKQTAETVFKKSLAQMKVDPDNPYCEVWRDREYKKDIRKDYCENVDCKKEYKRLGNHHIYLDKKKCKPIDIMTMCASCHAILHHKLQRGSTKAANPKDFIIINRPDHVSYIHKKSREIIKIRRLTWQSIQ